MYKFAHLGLVVKDCERSSDFYCRVLGCTVKDRIANEQLKIVYLQAGAITIELLEYLIPPGPRHEAGTLDHLAFSVPNIYTAIECLKAEKVEFLSDEPRKAMNGSNIIFFLGPDREKIELVEELVTQ